MKTSDLKSLADQKRAKEVVKKEVAPFSPSGEGKDTFAAINEIPIGDLVADHFGWEFNGKNFFRGQKKIACFVSDEGNFLVHGGTDHLPSEADGYSPFMFIKHIHNLGNNDTFDWFKEKYPSIKQISEKELKKKPQAEKVETHSIGLVFEELENESFEVMRTAGPLDPYNIFVRSAVLRIGAFSNIGKSKFGYFIAKELLNAGYKGIVFSTEVKRSFVLANFVSMIDREHFLSIMKKEVKPSDKAKDELKNLEIYDRRHNAFEIDHIIAQTKLSKPDFILIDFVQEIKDSEHSQDLFVRMSNYAQEIQSFAQEQNILVIDLSQVANQSLREDHTNYGFVALKGSGDLLSSADIIINLRRNKKKMPNYMRAEIIKHKYDITDGLELYCDLAYGEFRKLSGKDKVELKKQAEKLEAKEEFSISLI